ncbi:hypothetical protein BpHYR1_012656 [Brachionus plicatilis]|uniref:EF-hand domain-containing protein n=1 Tax=Brachionus plicatilis TaxID=10195 RepID=A0A3M7SV52_BRAPC|nr:hypothetical protein BpHYR1_012656 [Brachionus plicatilis]
MSFSQFRNIAGIDHQIDFNEYFEYTRQKYPNIDKQTVYRIAKEKFAFIDRDKNNKIDYKEFVDAQKRKYYHPVNNEKLHFKFNKVEQRVGDKVLYHNR